MKCLQVCMCTVQQRPYRLRFDISKQHLSNTPDVLELIAEFHVIF